MKSMDLGVDKNGFFTNQKSEGRRPAWRRPWFRLSPSIPRSGNVVAERGEQHVVDGLGRDAVRTRPSGLRQIGILQTPPESALRPLVHLVPETEAAFQDGPDIAGASAAGAGCAGCGRGHLGRAARVIGR